MGISPPKGVILYGAPGTGKTLLAKAVANQTSATFLRVVGSELIQKYLGDGPKLDRELFRVAEQHAPSIVFIDEIDAIGTKRCVPRRYFCVVRGFYDVAQVRFDVGWRTRNPAYDVGAVEPARWFRHPRGREGYHGNKQDRIARSCTYSTRTYRSKDRIPITRRQDQAAYFQASSSCHDRHEPQY